MPLYIADYLADTGHLAAAEHGAYLLLIMHYWQKGSLPVEDRQLARICRMTEDEFSNAKALLSEFFSDGWCHERIDAELAKAETKHARRVEAGSRGGRPKKKQCESNAFSNGSSNAQASSSQPQPDSSLRSHSSSGADDVGAGELKARERTRLDDSEVLQDVVEVWNREAVPLGLPAVDVISERRKSAIRARLREFGDFGFDDPVAGMRRLVENIRGSPHCLGKTNGWRADFDFATSPKGFTKIMENAYASARQGNGYGGTR